MQDLLQFIEIIVVPIIGYIFLHINKLEKRLNDKIGNDSIASNKANDKLHEEMARVQSEMSAWQLEVVRNYATRAELEKLEQRIIGAIERLEKKIEAHFFKNSGD